MVLNFFRKKSAWARLAVMAGLLSGLLMAGVRPAATSRVIASCGVSPQLGFAAAKLLQQFHLPGSPSQLLSFILEYFLKQKLGNTLPLNLNASHAFPSVENSQLPGSPFNGKLLKPADINVLKPLPPGDYVIPVMAYCTQYSVHRPGQGTAYKLAPMEGTAVDAIATFLWRGTLAGKSPQELQAVNWAIQSGVTYARLPKPYQTLVDQLIPDFKDRLKGNVLEVIQSTYKDITVDPRQYIQSYIKDKFGKTLPLMLMPKIAVPAPPLDQLLLKMGAAGQLALDAEKQSSVFLNAYTTKERGEQKLFAGQGEALPAQPATVGDWTERIPEVAYLRFKVQGGNMQGNNLLEIRILPVRGNGVQPTAASFQANGQLIKADFASNAASSLAAVPRTSIYGLLGVDTAAAKFDRAVPTGLTASGVIGYSQGGGGAQALVPVALWPPQEHAPAKVQSLIYKPLFWFDSGNNKLAHFGVCIYLGAEADTPRQYVDYNWEQTYVTSFDPKAGKPEEAACPANTPLSDPCPRDKNFEDSPLYRPDPNVNKNFSAAWGWDFLFRDLPERKYLYKGKHNDFSWSATAAFVGIPFPGSPVPLVENITYGFTLHGSQLTLSPLVIDGTEAVKGSSVDLNDPGQIKAVIAKKGGNDPCIPYPEYQNKPVAPPMNIPGMPGDGSMTTRASLGVPQ